MFFSCTCFHWCCPTIFCWLLLLHCVIWFWFETGAEKKINLRLRSCFHYVNKIDSKFDRVINFQERSDKCWSIMFHNAKIFFLPSHLRNFQINHSEHEISGTADWEHERHVNTIDFLLSSSQKLYRGQMPPYAKFLLC